MKRILCLVLMMSSSPLYAGWSLTTGLVERVYSHNGSHVIRTTLTDNVCTHGNFWWPADDSDARDMFALALAALPAGKAIQVHYDTADLDCQHGKITKITHMSSIQ
jgi:hypothetical protein